MGRPALVSRAPGIAETVTWEEGTVLGGGLLWAYLWGDPFELIVQRISPRAPVTPLDKATLGFR